MVLLTAGTAGIPKAALRSNPRDPAPAGAVLSRMPLGPGERIMVAAPIVHGWGWAALQFGLALRSDLVLAPHFDPEATLAAVAQHKVTALFAVPVMLRQLVDLPEQTRSRYDLSSLRIVACGGGAQYG